MKIIVMGRPGKVHEHGPFMITAIRDMQKTPSLPKGLPPMPQSNLLYLLYMAKKHWKKVADSLQDPEDMLIVEGFLNYDKEMKRMAIYTQSATTKLIERARREQQKAEAAAAKAAAEAAAKAAAEAEPAAEAAAKAEPAKAEPAAKAAAKAAAGG